MTPRRISLLRFYSRFRGRVPTVGEALARQPLMFWLAHSGLLALVSAYAYIAGGTSAILLVGIVVGALARDVGWLLRFKRDWPTLDRVLNWQAVEQELSVHGEADA